MRKSALIRVGLLIALFFLLWSIRLLRNNRARTEIAHTIRTSHSIETPFLPVLVPVCHRADYLKTVLEGLLKCDEISNTVIIISQDCGDREVTDLINTYRNTYKNIYHFTHNRPLFGLPSLFISNEYATTANVKYLLEFAFEYLRADGAIMLESDLLPSRDFYTYHKWAYETILTKQENVLAINSFNFQSRQQSKKYDLIPFEFTCWGWSTSSKMWFQYLRDGWAVLNNWDIALQLRIRIRNNLICVTPLLARVKNIGQHGINFNVKDDDWNREFGAVYIEQQESISYSGVSPNLVDFDKEGFCRHAGLCD